MHVDEDLVGLGELAECRLDLGERRAACFEVQVSAHVDHAEAHALVLDDAQPAPGLAAQKVDRTQDARLVIEIRVDLAPVVGVVAQSDHVDAGREQLVGDLRRDPEPSRGVLAVDDDERRRVALAQHRQAVHQRETPNAAYDVAHEQDRGCVRLGLSHTLAVVGRQ